MKSADSSEQQLPSIEVPSKYYFLNENGGSVPLFLSLFAWAGFAGGHITQPEDRAVWLPAALPSLSPADRPPLRPPPQLTLCAENLLD